MANTAVIRGVNIKNKEGANEIMCNALLLLWIIRLFRPDWLVSNLVPGMTKVRMASTIILYLLAAVWITTAKNKYHFKQIAVFLVSMLASTLFAENIGRPREILRIVFELYLMGCITLTYFDTIEKAEKLFIVIVMNYVYFAIWGMYGKGVISWDYILNEEDAYGPLMVMGVPFCAYYGLATKNKLMKSIAIISTALCVAGVVVSFARGAFLALLCVLFAMWVESKKKIAGIIFMVMAVLAIYVSAQIFFQENEYWKEMETISEGTAEGTGRDRRILWTIAWEEFKDHPLIGVGPLNYGVVAPRYVAAYQERGRYEDPGTIWGRALHNAYFQILSEQGIIGTIIFIFIIYEYFIKSYSSKKIYWRKLIKDKNNQNIRKIYYLMLSFEIVMIGFLANAFFYDIIYFPWFWELVIFNTLLWTVAKSSNSNEECAMSAKI